jgi:hypothetical protein
VLSVLNKGTFGAAIGTFDSGPLLVSGVRLSLLGVSLWIEQNGSTNNIYGFVVLCCFCYTSSAICGITFLPVS